MAKSDEEERRERLELLKLKQGLITKSDIIPEEEEKPAPALLTAKQKIANFFYYYKWVILIAVVGAVLAVSFIVAIVTAEKPDIEVLLIGTYRDSDYAVRATQVEEALEQFCPDFNGDGNVHVGVLAIDLGSEPADGQYYMTQTMMFDLELEGERCLVISDDGLVDYMLERTATKPEVFMPIRGELSVPVAETALGGVLEEFPENAYLYFLKDGREETLVRNSEEVLSAILAQ